MRLGFSSMNTPEDLAPDVSARALEERGYDSLWIGEHSHIPLSRLTPYPSGGEMPDQYRRMMDPFASLLLAATATTTLLVGTGVALPLERDLLAMAKLITTVDRLSGRRLQFGVGVGWNQEELANHRPIPWRERYRALAECIAALETLWRDEESAFHGTYYDFDPVWSLPKPLQQPHPPIWCGTGQAWHPAGWHGRTAGCRWMWRSATSPGRPDASAPWPPTPGARTCRSPSSPSATRPRDPRAVPQPRRGTGGARRIACGVE